MERLHVKLVDNPWARPSDFDQAALAEIILRAYHAMVSPSNQRPLTAKVARSLVDPWDFGRFFIRKRTTTYTLCLLVTDKAIGNRSCGASF